MFHPLLGSFIPGTAQNKMFDPYAAIRKLSGDASADVLPFVNVAEAAGQLTGAPYSSPVNATPGVNRAPNVTSEAAVGSEVIDPVQEAERNAEAERRAQANRGLQAQQAHLQGIENNYNASMAGIAGELARILGGYQAQTDRYEGDHARQMATNRSNFDRNIQEAMINAARGRQGLFGTLSALGALSGSGIQLADRAVQQGANADLAGANENFQTNADDLSQAIALYRDEDQARRDAANRQAESLRQQADHTRLSDQRSTYEKMVDLYATLGNQAEADRYARMGAELAPQIGNKAFIPGTAFTEGVANYNPSALGNYTGYAPSVSVTQGAAQPGSLIPGLMASIRRRDEERG